MRVFAFLVGAVSAFTLKKGQAPPGKVYFSDSEVAPSAECQRVPQGMQTSSTEPRIKVCGTGIKVTAYLLNNCESYIEKDIGACDTALPSSTCVELAPGGEGAPHGMQHFQSYKIGYCNE